MVPYDFPATNTSTPFGSDEKVTSWDLPETIVEHEFKKIVKFIKIILTINVWFYLSFA